MAAKYLYFDIESHNAGRQYSMPPEEFVRLFQYAWDDGPVRYITDYQEMLNIVRQADYVVGHNILSFDLSVLFGVESLEPLQMALDNKVIDTLIIASLITPAPYYYTDRHGRGHKDAAKPANALSWLSLDNLCFQLGIDGKLGNLDELAKRHNPPKTKVSELDYSLIPLDDSDFLAYAVQDVEAVRSLWKKLKSMIAEQDYNREYIWRELLLAAITSQMSDNGFKVDVKRAQARVDELLEARNKTMDWLVKEYQFPTEGKAPWSSKAGIEVIFKVLSDYGITEETHPDWEKTDTGSLSLGGKVLISLTEGTELEEFGHALASLKGQRALSQLALDCMYEDGKVHPSVTPFQRSGRWSVTRPGLTVTGNNDDEEAGIIRSVDKEYYCAEDGYVLAELDFSAADARAMAALSGDPDFMKRFIPDENGDLPDPHNMSGVAFFGEEMYYARMDNKGKHPILRTPTKPGAHGLNYHLGAFKMAHMLNKTCKANGIDLHFWAPKSEKSMSKLPPIDKRPDSIDTRQMIARFDQSFPFLKMFKENAVNEAERLGYVENTWGRRMRVDEGRAWNQAPALWGQSTTREMMGDALIRLVRKNIEYARWLKLIVHDALVVQLPQDTAESDVLIVKECMEHPFDPQTVVGVPIDFPVGYGIGKNWRQAGH